MSLVLLTICLISRMYQIEAAGEQCKHSERSVPGKALKGHTFKEFVVKAIVECRNSCENDPRCASYNYYTPNKICELNSQTKEARPDDFVTDDLRFYMKREDTDECVENTHKCSANAYCNNTKGGYDCTCHPGYYGDGKNCEPVSSCKDLFDRKMSTESKAYPLILGDAVFDIYCNMAVAPTENDACGVGGWTLVMKIDGKKNTFHYNSDFWSNNETFNLFGGKTGFDDHETKLPTYWNTSFSKICLGMKINQQIKFIVINKQANSLYSLIADGQYHNTSLGRDTWKSLIGSEASLQDNCNKEGFNAVSGNPLLSKARIGILGNNENDCYACDSRIGFGTGGFPDENNACGNEAMYGGDNNDKHIKAMGYILLQ